MFGFLSKRQNKNLRAFEKKVASINSLEPQFKALSDDALRAYTDELRAKVRAGTALDELLEPAFAAVREAGRRTLGLRLYDVQLMGGIVLHQGAIAEMRTGEGKTLAATAPVYLNALAGNGTHVVTVNDYLAERDAEWMGAVYNALGLNAGVITHGKSDAERRAAYAADVTYGTNNEFGFDYLRDNMKYSLSDMVQRQLGFAIVDEVDSILIDESRTPLVISGPTDDRSELYMAADALIEQLDKGDYELDEKQRSISFTEEGSEKVETILTKANLLEGSLFDPSNVTLLHHANQALRAHKLFQKDRDYIVKGGQVVLIDEFTGRMTPGRRLSEGLHQAIEARESCPIQPENQTLASITFQNYFRLYDKLSGMTGTAMTEASEFADIYGLPVITIPTNEPIRRDDEDDVVFLTLAEKYKAIIEDISECVEKEQPVLVGTVSIEKSEIMSELLRKNKIGHQVLNARHHEQEAHIIAQAGVPGAVTVATNMAGRGTDIQLGGNFEIRLADESARIEAETGEPMSEEALEQLGTRLRAEIAKGRERALTAGGLYVLGTERHESRRIDNQLRGRTGRQGDPGKSCFYVSLEDDLLRIFAADKMDAMMRRFGMREDEAIAHPWMSKALETSQKKVEQRNFEIRKNLLKYDDVINDQRHVIFAQRLDFIRADDVSAAVRDMRHHVLEDMLSERLPEKSFAGQWHLDELIEDLQAWGVEAPVREWSQQDGIGVEEMSKLIARAVDSAYARKTAEIAAERMRWLEKQILLQNIDTLWREHLVRLEQLRSVIHLRGFAQRDPLNEYKSEAFALFETLLSDLQIAVTSALMRPEELAPEPPSLPREMIELHVPAAAEATELPSNPVAPGPAQTAALPVSGGSKISRNAPCPCGSGRKYKHCHGSVSMRRGV